MNSKEFDVITVGELNVDLILNKIDSFPEIGKEKISEEMLLTLGSSSAIFASNLSALGAKVAFLGKIGKDYFGDLVLDRLRAKGVDVSMIIRDKRYATGATIVLNFNEDRAMVTHPGAMNELTIDDITREKIVRARHLHFSSYFLQNGMKQDVHTMFKTAKENGLTTSFDMQWDPGEKWEMDYEKILPFVDIFFPNEKELFALTGENDVTKGIAKLSSFGNNIIVKMGSRGSVSFSNNEVRKSDAFFNPLVIDAIGAGDSFNAGFILKYVQGEDILKCQEYGNLLGAINTTAAGGTTAFKNLEEIKKKAKDFFSVRI